MPTPFSAAEGIRDSRSEEVRRRNTRIAFTARTQRFGDGASVPFMCECSDDRCTELVRLTLAQYDDARSGGDYLVAPGHQVGEAHVVRVRDACWLYRAG